MKTYMAGEAQWQLPVDHAPPLGVKVLLLNPGGVCVVGVWQEWAVAWAPLPKVPENVKQKLMRLTEEHHDR